MQMSGSLTFMYFCNCLISSRIIYRWFLSLITLLGKRGDIFQKIVLFLLYLKSKKKVCCWNILTQNKGPRLNEKLSQESYNSWNYNFIYFHICATKSGGSALIFEINIWGNLLSYFHSSYVSTGIYLRYRVTHKGWEIKDDCTEFNCPSSHDSPCSYKLVSKKKLLLKKMFTSKSPLSKSFF